MAEEAGAQVDEETAIGTGSTNLFDGKEIKVVDPAQTLTTEDDNQQRYELHLKDAIKQKEAELAERTGDVKYWLDNLDGPNAKPTEPTPLTPQQQAAKDIIALNNARAGIRQMGQKK